MQEYEFDLDKLIKPITKAVESLKRAKDKDLREALTDIGKKVDKLEEESGKLANSKPVVDEKTFAEKKKCVESLAKACDAADTAVGKLLTNPIHGGDSGQTARDSLEVKEPPKGVKKPTVEDLPVVGKQLQELKERIAATKKKADSDLAGFMNWFKAGSKPDSIEVKIPKSMTNMIEMVATKGGIALPNEQAFEATITIDGIEKRLLDNLQKFPQEFLGEAGRALEPLKQQVAKAFKDWNKEFEKVEQEFDEANAKKLFESINDYFKTQLPKFIKSGLEAAAMQALKDSLPRSQDVVSKVKICADANYGGFAEFAVTFPDNPADGAIKGLSESFGDVDSANKGYADAVSRVGSSNDAILKSADSLQQLLDKPSRNLVKDLEREHESLARATRDFESGLKDGEAGRASLAKYLSQINKTVNDPKGGLKGNATISQRDFDDLRKTLTPTLKRLDKDIESELRGLQRIVTAAKEIATGVSDLGRSSKSAPADDDVRKTSAAVKKSRGALNVKGADLQAKLDVSSDVEKLKSLSDKLKD